MSQAVDLEKLAAAPSRRHVARAAQFAGAIVGRVHDERRNVEARCGRGQIEFGHVDAARTERGDERIHLDAFLAREPAHEAFVALRRRDQRDAAGPQAALEGHGRGRATGGVSDRAGQRPHALAERTNGIRAIG